MPGGEVGAMVAVEDRRNAAGMPAGVLFVPDRRSQRECGGFLKAESIADIGERDVVCQPRQALLSIALDPEPDRTGGFLGGTRHLRLGDAFFQSRADDGKTF